MNSPVAGEFPAQKSSNAENVSIWWRHHGCQLIQNDQNLKGAYYFRHSHLVTLDHISMVSCQKGPTRHANAWQIGPFWQDTLDIQSTVVRPQVDFSVFLCGSQDWASMAEIMEIIIWAFQGIPLSNSFYMSRKLVMRKILMRFGRSGSMVACNNQLGVLGRLLLK